MNKKENVVLDSDTSRESNLQKFSIFMAKIQSTPFKEEPTVIQNYGSFSSNWADKSVQTVDARKPSTFCIQSTSIGAF